MIGLGVGYRHRSEGAAQIDRSLSQRFGRQSVSIWSQIVTISCVGKPLHSSISASFLRHFRSAHRWQRAAATEFVRNVALFAVSPRVTNRETIELIGGRRRLDY